MVGAGLTCGQPKGVLKSVLFYIVYRNPTPPLLYPDIMKLLVMLARCTFDLEFEDKGWVNQKGGNWISISSNKTVQCSIECLGFLQPCAVFRIDCGDEQWPK